MNYAAGIGGTPMLKEWLTQHRPTLQTLAEKKVMEENAQYAAAARNQIKVAQEVPKDLFLHYVLPYQHFDEPVDNWRPKFFNALKPKVMNAKTLHEAADKTILHAWKDLGKPVTFKSNCTPSIMAPVSETLKFGHASCTGCSIFVADALRAVGIPARVVGTPEWNVPTGGNHNWVEVWTGEGKDGWHFFDAVPSNKVEWDTAWFMSSNVKQAVAGGKHGIYAPVWDSSMTQVQYPITWRDTPRSLPGIDRTAFYKQYSGA